MPGVAYAANGATSGAVPVDAESYESGDTVTVLGNTGVLARTGYTFIGWNTAADGSGFFRAAAATFEIGADSVTLYAQWAQASIVTVDELKAYARKHDGDTDTEPLYQIYIDAAIAVVEKKLGYSPAQASRSEIYYGDGKRYLQLRARPIVSIASVEVDDVALDVADIEFGSVDEWILGEDGAFPAGSRIEISYVAGYATIPAIIRLTVLRIATLMTMEAGENIGVTSQSFDNNSTRNFISYTNYEKYLAPLESLCVHWLGRNTP